MANPLTGCAPMDAIPIISELCLLVIDKSVITIHTDYFLDRLSIPYRWDRPINTESIIKVRISSPASLSFINLINLYSLQTVKRGKIVLMN